MVHRSSHASLPAEKAYCHSCGLAHTRTADWLCPRCGMPADTEPRSHRAEEEAREEEPADFPVGSMVAGAVLAVSGAALLVGFLKHPASVYRWPALAAASVLLVLALELLLKVNAGRWIVVVAALLVVLIASEGALRERVPDLFRDPLPDPVRRFLRDVLRDLRLTGIASVAASAASCLLLVVGRPRWPRIAAGAVLAVPLVALLILHAAGS